ncbi:MAG: DUF4965 domain-containing protein, partial [Clostridia bacterium]|nr:DUF4965 domain-containing protein [Clostridia bacterium]
MSFKMRAPSVPLINVDPYFNIWSNADHLNDKNTVHWTGSSHALTGVVTVDGTDYCFMGSVRNMAKLPQTDLDISALSTVYTFANESIVLTARFTTPLLPDDLVLASRPIAYLQVTVASADGAHHIAKVSITADDELCLNKKGDCHTKTLPLNVNGLCGMGVTATEQKVLTRSGDNLRIEWGTFWLATSNPASAVTVDRRAAQTGAVAHTLCVKVNLDTTNNPSALYLLGYDDEYSMVYFGTQLRSLWNADGKKLTCLLKQAADEYPAVLARCEAFSQKLYADALAAGGEKYAELCSLAYRQTFGAHKLCTAPDGEVLFISKECFSNGCAATVDVSYPSIPLYLLYNPELVKGMYRPILHYASSPAWPFDFAPHDAGQYPLVNGQVYGDNQLKYQMPVEECGNMLVSLAAVCIAEKSTDFVAPHMGLLQTWCDYLLNNGLDPANQLCTDDFAGHLAHNCNLSVKAVMGITAFSIIKRMMNETAEADRLLAAAREMAAKWAEMAANGDGSYRLAFDAADSFSMKYNMVWDLLFGTDIFPKEIFATETASYYKHINAYGMPLDNRETYTKSDWLVWSATLCDDPAYFKAMVEPLWEAYNASESRVPLTDWYDTVTALQICWDDS